VAVAVGGGQVATKRTAPWCSGPPPRPRPPRPLPLPLRLRLQRPARVCCMGHRGRVCHHRGHLRLRLLWLRQEDRREALSYLKAVGAAVFS
jgi:hypothetical protein